jgi:hypothetical protein
LGRSGDILPIILVSRLDFRNSVIYYITIRYGDIKSSSRSIDSRKVVNGLALVLLLAL